MSGRPWAAAACLVLSATCTPPADPRPPVAEPVALPPEIEPAPTATWERTWPNEVCVRSEDTRVELHVTACGCSAVARCRIEPNAPLPPSLIVELSVDDPVPCRDCVTVEARCHAEAVPDLVLVSGEVPFSPLLREPTVAHTECVAVPRPDELGRVFESAANVSIVRVDDVQADCSGVGGYHSTLAVDETLAGRPLETSGQTRRAFGFDYRAGDLLLAVLAPLDAPRKRPPDRGRCLPALPTVDAEVVLLLPIADREQGRALWEHLRRPTR